METLLWFAFGLITVYLMYGEQKKLPIFKVVLIVLFGGISFFVWLLFNMKTEVDNWFALFRPQQRKPTSGKQKKNT